MNIRAFLAVFLLDRATKSWAEKNVREGETVAVIPKRLYFVRVKNYGFANGFLKERPALVRGVSVITALLVLFGSLKELKGASPGARLGFSLMLGGGLSNLADRLKNGCVTDFIRFKDGKALIYNAADLFIFAGGIIYAVFSLLQRNNSNYPCDKK